MLMDKATYGQTEENLKCNNQAQYKKNTTVPVP